MEKHYNMIFMVKIVEFNAYTSVNTPSRLTTHFFSSHLAHIFDICVFLFN